MKYDSWLYNGEPIADARIEYLRGTVDRFIVVEAKQSFSGILKSRLFVEDAPWRNDPDVDVRVVDLTHTDPWQNETKQRNACLPTMVKGDVVVCADVDEIPERDVFDVDLTHCHAALLDQSFFYYNLNWQKKSRWRNAFVSSHVPFNNQGRNYAVQDLRGKLRTGIKSGWHVSYAESPERIAHKIRAFSHQELNRPEFTDEENVRRCLTTGSDLFGRGPGEDCLWAPDLSALPLELVRFNDLICKKQGLVRTENGFTVGA